MAAPPAAGITADQMEGQAVQAAVPPVTRQYSVSAAQAGSQVGVVQAGGPTQPLAQLVQPLASAQVAQLPVQGTHSPPLAPSAQ